MDSKKQENLHNSQRDNIFNRKDPQTILFGDLFY
jgi:hypothetical protein